MNAIGPRATRAVARFLGYAIAAAVIAAPVAAERAVESVRFEDRLGTLPVEVTLSHNGVSTLDTGVLGQLYWDRTGFGGFGAHLRATGPPEAGGSTLAAYVRPAFVRANVQLVNDPEEVARTYGDQLQSRLWSTFVRFEIVAALVGGLALSIASRVRGGATGQARTVRRVVISLLSVAMATGIATGTALWLFARWAGSADVGDRLPMPGVDGLAFSSPQMLEIAQQIQPFVQKNSERTRGRNEAYLAAADSSLRTALAERAASLRPREGERIVLAEADPQGSNVATRLRTALYPLLVEHLGDDAFAVRTISGDLTSNGTIAEAGFVRDEAEAFGGLPTVAVKGDHDTKVTLEQMRDSDILNPHFDPDEVGGVRVVVGNDPAFKTLFGGMVINDTGTTETELGTMLREEVDSRNPDEPLVVLLHQPQSAAGYIGIDSLSELDAAVGSESTPRDDGIPDLPPGIINIGHLHDFSPPKVIWNTDGEVVTWTVVNQLGTSGGVEENPTFDRFSTPFSTPLKAVSLQLQYVNLETGLQNGYATIDIAPDGSAVVTGRIDLGLPSS